MEDLRLKQKLQLCISKRKYQTTANGEVNKRYFLRGKRTLMSRRGLL
jgi:hypothetical protein